MKSDFILFSDLILRPTEFSGADVNGEKPARRKNKCEICDCDVKRKK